jgi:hypothetical protein
MQGLPQEGFQYEFILKSLSSSIFFFLTLFLVPLLQELIFAWLVK